MPSKSYNVDRFLSLTFRGQEKETEKRDGGYSPMDKTCRKIQGLTPRLLRRPPAFYIAPGPKPRRVVPTLASSQSNPVSYNIHAHLYSLLQSQHSHIQPLITSHLHSDSPVPSSEPSSALRFAKGSTQQKYNVCIRLITDAPRNNPNSPPKSETRLEAV